jgi:hypothetical protein
VFGQPPLFRFRISLRPTSTGLDFGNKTSGVIPDLARYHTLSLSSYTLHRTVWGGEIRFGSCTDNQVQMKLR